MKKVIVSFCIAAMSIPVGWSQEVNSNYYGIFTENPNILVKLPIDDVRGHVYVWEGTLSGLITDPYEGEGCLAFRSTGVGWWGFGIHDDSAVSLTHFQSGYLIFSLKTSAKDEFSIHVYGANKTEAKITFPQNSGPQNFKRDGAWHKIVFPIADLVTQGLDLSAVSIPFAAIGGAISNIAFDDIFYSIDNKGPDNPLAHPQPNPVDTSSTPTNPTRIASPTMKANLSYNNGILKINAAVPIRTLVVTDITGKIIARSQPNQSIYFLDTSNWVKGLYIVQTYFDQQKVITDKVVIY
ncbi:MAG: T9SS type A sorting domain-containing protein [Bacteroidales bacterium]